MKLRLTGLIASLLLAVSIAAVPAAALGGTWKWCSSNNEGTWNVGQYKVQNDNWGPGGPQTICANSPSDVQVTSNQNYGTQIVTYPDVGGLYTGADLPLSGFKAIYNSYTENFPADVVGEFADDIWLNNWSIEIMIWQDTHNEDPSYLPTIGHATIFGQNYTVYQNGSEYIFLLDHNAPTGQTHVKASINWLISNGFIPANPGVTEVEAGWEIANTNGPEVFNLTSYKLYHPAA